VPMSSTSDLVFSPAQREALLGLAWESIERGLHGERIRLDASHYDDVLGADGASFVTLNLSGNLRGCIGSLEAHQPLVLDVSSNAHSAAFRDPRFSPVSARDLPQLDIHISVLTPASPMTFRSEAHLIEQLQPGVDGLILSLGTQRGTFLPSVWESLPDARDFLQQLKRKAGLPADFWSDDVRVDRYSTVSVSR
jgi:AmmeMemoRadiSam system protein A